MRTISFTITGQRITGTAISDLVGNTKNYVEASFTFSSEWEGFFKIAIFTANGKQYPAILENNKCMVPDVAMSGDYMDVGVMAGYNGTTLSTDTFRVRIEESVRTKPPYDLITMFDGLSDNIADLQAEDDVLDAKIDLKQAKLLETPIEIDGVEYATVEAVLIALCAHAGSFDSALSSTSEKAVQNKVVKAAMDEKQGKTLDNSITIDGSTYTTVETALVAILAHIPAVDSTLSGSSTNPIQNKAVYEALALKQDKSLETPVTVGGESRTTVQAAFSAIAAALAQTQTIDTSLDTSSTNPVQNKAIAEAVNLKQGKALDTAITVNGTQYTTLESALGAINTLLAGHIATEVVSTNGVHHFRKDPNSNDLQYYDEQTETWITISTGGGGGTVTVDTALSTTSTNPVQNKVLTNYMYDNLQPKTMSSPITVGDVQYTTVETAIAAIIGAIPTVDAALDASSTNAIQNKAVHAGLAAKVTSALSSALTIDGVSKSTVEDALTALAGHTGNSVLSAAGIHNIRYYNSKLQGYNTTTGQWSDIVAGGSGDEERLDAIDQNILALTLALSIYQQAEVEGMANNIVVEVFDDTSGYVLVKGAFDSTNHQVYA